MKWLDELGIKKQLIAYLIVMILLSCMYTAGISLIYQLCATLPSILPLFIANGIMYIASCYVMGQFQFSLMQSVMKIEDKISFKDCFFKILLHFGLIYLLLCGGELIASLYFNESAVKMIVSAIVTLASVIYMPYQLLYYYYLFKHKSMLQSIKHAISYLIKNFQLLFYITLPIDIIICLARYFINNDQVFMMQSGHFVLLYNPFLSIFDYFPSNIITAIILIVVGTVIMMMFLLYSLYLIYHQNKQEA